MDVNLQFLGAAHCVTGSKYLLTLVEAGAQQQVMVDCGLFQGFRERRLRNREKLPLTPADVKIVILTHAHIDHSGQRHWPNVAVPEYLESVGLFEGL